MNSNPLRPFFPAFAEPELQNWLYFDSAATSQKLAVVIDKTQQYYATQSVNVHRSSHKLASQMTDEFEQARTKVQSFIGAKSNKEIVWTKGATESINLVAECLSKEQFNAGDEILISALEHHANIVPWQRLAEKFGFTIKVMPVNSIGILKLEDALALISSRTVLVAIGHVSNALGNINPIEPIIRKAREHKALTLIDGTQAVSHMDVDVQKLDCDFYVFSGHKMFGPTGVGALYGREALLAQMKPYQLGGEMIKNVSFSQTTYQESPLKFEAGTPNIAGVLGLTCAIDFIRQNKQRIEDTERNLYKLLHNKLLAIPQLRLWGEQENSISIQSLTVNGISQQDLGILLSERNVAVRAGHHCAMPLMDSLGIEGTIRVSLSCYNTEQEVVHFVETLKECIVLLTQDHKQAQLEVTTNSKAPQVSSEANVKPIAQSISKAKSWDQTYRQIMLAGKQLPRLPEQDKGAASEIFGCESQVWLKIEFVDQCLILAGDSPSKIVRGLLAVIFEALQGHTPKQALAFDLSAYLEHLGLAKHLSQSRGNGLQAVMDKIVAFCERQSS